MVEAAPPDWRDAEAYAWLAPAERGAFAWEWLRRTEPYRAVWQDADAVMAIGLLRGEPPWRDARHALPLWSRQVDPGILRGLVLRPGYLTGVQEHHIPFDFRRCGAGLRTLPGEAVEHVRIGDGQRSARFDLIGGSVDDGPLAIAWLLAGLHPDEAGIAHLRRLASLCVGYSSTPPAANPLAQRWILALRVHDALATGASHQDIARGLYGSLVAPARWRIEASSYRTRVQRLAAAARRYLALPVVHWLAG